MPPPAFADDRATLTLGPASAGVRRAVGPIAWAVLESLAASAVEATDEVVSHESVRGIAGCLGMAKDTVARALRRLAAEQLITHVERRADDGRFGTSHYRLDLPGDLFLSLSTIERQPTAPARSPRRRPTGQLSIFDARTTEVEAPGSIEP